MQRADLHFHSTCSDGKHSIEWLAQKLGKEFKSGLRLAVLTDHDGVDGFEVFSELTSKYWPSIRACELSCYMKRETHDQELHLLIYGIEKSDDFLNSIFERFRHERRRRFFEMCRRLNEAGFQVNAEAIAAEHPGRLGRPHVADALVEAGHATNRKDAFERFLYKESPYNIPKWKLDIDEILTHTRVKSYPTSIAHPGIYQLNEADLQELKDMGLSAIEVFHPRHTLEQLEFYREQAEYLGLSISGGSDFHDAQSDKIDNQPSLGMSAYSLEMAESFLRDIL